MSKSALVKVGVPSEQAHSMRRLRRIRQILEQHDAAVARLDAATNERIREVTNEVDEPTAEEQEPATATA